MATYAAGINGAFNGKVGTVVGSSWKGIPYMRSKPKKRRQPAEAGEQQNRSKFAMAHHCLQPLLDIVRCGFKGYSPTVEGYNAAKSWLLKNAFEGAGEELRINPALIKISSGDLPLPANITAEKIGSDQLQFTWDTGDVEGGSKYDQAMIVAYDMVNRDVDCCITSEFRKTGSDSLKIKPDLPGQTYHLYIAFLADDRSRQSDSVYLGTMEF